MPDEELKQAQDSEVISTIQLAIINGLPIALEWTTKDTLEMLMDAHEKLFSEDELEEKLVKLVTNLTPYEQWSAIDSLQSHKL